jgi:hypothetical protein
MRTASWVIVDKVSGKAIFETFSQHIAEKINQEKYLALPALTYLQNLNKSIRGQ